MKRYRCILAESSADAPNIIQVNWTDIEQALLRKVHLPTRRSFIEKYGDAFNLGTMLKTAVVISGDARLLKKMDRIKANNQSMLRLFNPFSLDTYWILYSLSKTLDTIAGAMRPSNVKEAFDFRATLRKFSSGRIKQLMDHVMEQARFVWDWFFGSEDTYSDVTVRRRRQLLLSFIIMLIAFVVKLIKLEF